MVELRLDLTEDIPLPSDTFVSVRVGDFQKLSKLSPSRTYRFPNADRHYGKIEVFKRIGVCSVDVDPLNEDPREVSIHCGESQPELGFKVAVEASDNTKKKLAAEKEEAEKKGNSKAREAKEYLAAHQLEVQLSEAMQALLRERPANPKEFLAQVLMGNGTPLSAKPRVKAMQPVPPSDPRPSAQNDAAAPGNRKLVPTAQPSTVSLVPFQAYYPVHFKGLGSGPLAQLHGMFPTSAPAKTVVVAKLGSQDYYKQNFISMKVAAFTSIHDKFAAKNKADSLGAPAAPAGGAKDRSAYRLMPSVGTWLQPRGKKGGSPPAASRGLPEVSTSQATAGPAGAGQSPSSSPTTDPTWMLKPSIGTWMAKPRIVNLAKGSYKFRPSVGSWLQPLPADSVPAPKKAPAMVMSSSMLLGGEFFTCGIPHHIRFV